LILLGIRENPLGIESFGYEIAYISNYWKPCFGVDIQPIRLQQGGRE
jgi:hypothetical protein